MSTINERIKERRLQLNMTLLDVASRLGVRETTAQRYESGAIKNISHETICKLSEILHCSPSYLMGWDDKVPFDISPVEKEIICKYRALSDDAKDMLLRSLGIEGKKESEESCAG